MILPFALFAGAFILAGAAAALSLVAEWRAARALEAALAARLAGLAEPPPGPYPAASMCELIREANRRRARCRQAAA